MEPLKDSPLDLFTSRTETGWELNMDGDMLMSNEPHPPGSTAGAGVLS